MDCINNTKKGYGGYAVADSHVHIAFAMPIGLTERSLDRYMTYFGLERAVLLALPHSDRAAATDPANNLKALYLKRKLNALWPEKRLYAFGGLYHHFDRRDTADGLLEQLTALRETGFDGLKVLLGKPRLRKRLGVGLDDELLEPVWRYCERERFPVTLHLGDPAAYWEKGGKGEPPEYGEDVPSLKLLRAEFRRVLERHPDLDVALCHFCFLADEPERAEKLMERYPRVFLDLTPGSEMYYWFSQRPDFWRDFFVRYQKRILFGTDTDNWASPEELGGCEHNFSYPFNLVRNALEGRAAFRFEDHDYGLLRPLSLPEEALKNIYSQNLVRRLNEPAPIDADAFKNRCRVLLARYENGRVPDGTPERRLLEENNLREIVRTFT